MTTSTPNLGLVLYNSSTDSAEYFSNFRAVIAGTSLSSNFYKIDTAYGSMQTEIDDIQAGAYFTLASYISANYYEATVTGVTAYNTGMKIILSLDTASAGTVTLNINSLGIKSVMKINSAGTPVNISAGELMVGKYYFFAYDGTRWVWVEANSADQIYIPGSSGNVVTVGSGNTLDGTTTQSILISQTTNSATAKTTIVNADKIGLVDSEDSNTLKSVTWSTVKTMIGSVFGVIANALTSKTSPVGADYVAIGDSESSNATKKLLLSNMYKSLGTGTPTSQTALLGDGSWGSVASFWTSVLGTPTRVGNTSFTVTGDYTAILKKGLVIKWTESSSIKVAMISIPSTYGSPNTTVTIVGDTMSSIDSSSMKYSMIGVEPFVFKFAIAGTIGATGTDVTNCRYAEEPLRVIGADLQVGTAGTTNATTIDINKNGTTMFTTKPTLATTVATSPTPFTVDNPTSLSLADKVTLDIDAIQTTPAVDLYVTLYVYPTRYLDL